MKLFLAALTLVFFSLLTWNCTKIDTTTIGNSLIPAVDNVSTFDTTISVIANNYDSSGKDCIKLYPTDDRPMGFISNDPLFGNTNANIYVEFKPPYFPYSFPVTRTLDSAILVLSYKRSYGDSTAPQKVNVFQISNIPFKADSSTCTFQDYDFPLLGSNIFTPQRLADSVIRFREKAINELRIPLSSAFAQSFFSRDSTNAFKSDSAFKRFFNGFAIAPDLSFGGKAICFFNLVDSNSKIAFYYHYLDTTMKQGLTNFRLSNSASSYSQSATYVNRSRGNSEITLFQNRPSTGDSSIFIQTSPGSYALIQTPALVNLNNRIIHRAELILEQVYSPSPSEQFFTTPSFLYLDVRDSSNNFRPELCDFNVSGGSGPNFGEFGGFRTLANDYLGRPINRYTFNISRYVQSIVTKQSPVRTFRLSAPAIVKSPTFSEQLCNTGTAGFNIALNAPLVGRVKLGGGNNSNYRMRLHIIYSKL